MKIDKNCPHCESPLRVERRAYSMRGVYLGRFDFYVCPVCGKVYHPKKAAIEIEEAAKKKGWWGHEVNPDAPGVSVVVKINIGTSSRTVTHFVAPGASTNNNASIDPNEKSTDAVSKPSSSPIRVVLSEMSEPVSNSG